MRTNIILSLLLISNIAWGDYEFFRGVRQMGMGGASIAVVNDETSVLSNPNGLGRLRDSFYTIFDPEITASTDGADTLLGTAVIGSVDAEDVFNDLSGSDNDPYYFKGQTFPSIVFPNFGVGLLGRYEVTAQRLSDGTLDYIYQNDYSLNLGFNMKFWGGRVKFGVAGRLINRVEYNGNLNPLVDNLEVSAFADEGMGLGVDAGLTLAAPWKWIPTLSVLVRDVGNTSFTMGSGLFTSATTTPNDVYQSVDVAVAIFPIYSKYTRGVLTVEYTGIDNTENVDDHMDRLHIGTEVNLFDAYFVRAGYHEGDWTAGLEYASGIFQFQMATYSEEIVIGTTEKRDRRGILKFGVRF